jgi:outer membrane protein OmpA-like peptidoglycan-associated protein
MLRTDRKRSFGRVVSSAAMLVASFALLACGGSIVFQGQTPIAVAGNAPAPPPPPPPEPEPPKRVEVTEKSIEIHEKIQFDYNKSTIKEVSHDLLNEIADVIKKHPQIKKIAIEGHASAEGDDNYNLRLSDARAKAVMEYLVTTGGVEKERLTAKGFGESKPLASNDTEEGRETNRRVEFNILERDDKSAAGASATPAGDATKSDAK